MALLKYEPPTTPLDVVHYDDHFVVINKPSGLLSVSGNKPHLHYSAQTMIEDKYGFAQAVHRLDMATSGLIIFALSKKADSDLKRQFRERIPQKSYIALVNGIVELESGTIDLPLSCDWLLRPRQQVDFQFGKKSVSKFKVLQRNSNNTTLVELEPVTGRSHQLRVHMASLGHPILGDKFYAPKNIAKRTNRLCLHAANIGFAHPITGVWINLHTPVSFNNETVN